jgi:hypothetical protein
MLTFADELRFITMDTSRTSRVVSPLSLQVLENKHKKLFTKELCEGKSILDLGSCLGATGWWCLHQGATHYTGVELQDYYFDSSKVILEDSFDKSKFEIVQDDVEHYLSNTKDKFDIVVMSGILHAFLDYYSILKHISSIAQKFIVTDVIHLQNSGSQSPTIELIRKHEMSKADGPKQMFSGLSSCISLPALLLLFESLGFNSTTGSDSIIPSRAHDIESLDPYVDIFKVSPLRYLLIFEKCPEKQIRTLIDVIRNA